MEAGGEELRRRAAAARSQLEDQLERLGQSVGELRATRQAAMEGRPARDALRESGYARALARLETLPVIEQAKGVLMARGARSPEDAFSMLRRASQRSNIPVRDLAGEIVRRACEASAGRPDELASNRATAPNRAAAPNGSITPARGPKPRPSS